MERLHIIVSYSKGQAKALYLGPEGTAADKAYDTAKGCETVEHYQYPMPTRRREGDSAVGQSIIRQHSAPALPKA